MARKLRIAVSVFFAVVAVALCILCVRSHRLSYNISGPLVASHFLNTNTTRGLWFLSIDGVTPSLAGLPDDRWQWSSTTLDPNATDVVDAISHWRFEWIPIPPHETGFVLWFPIWFPSLVCFAIAGILWLPMKRFRLRTLLIAMTLVAIVLGLGVWLAS